MTDPASGPASWDASVFDRIYAASQDPWGFETSAYERAKYDDTLAQLGARRFTDGLELGCSIGVMTSRLQAGCDRLLALDAAAAAVDAARARCRDFAHVRIEQALLPGQWPGGAYELIVISELLYFLSAADIRRLAELCSEALLPGGMLLLVNWTGPTDTPTTGEAAADCFADAVAGMVAETVLRRESYRLDRMVRAPR